MNHPNLKRFPETKTDLDNLGQSVRKVYRGNGWTANDDEVDTLMEHLRFKQYTLGDLKKAVFQYVQDGGKFKPLYGDLSDYLKMARDRRMPHKPAEHDRFGSFEYSEEAQAQVAMMLAEMTGDVIKKPPKLTAADYNTDPEELARIEAECDRADRAMRDKQLKQPTGDDD